MSDKFKIENTGNVSIYRNNNNGNVSLLTSMPNDSNMVMKVDNNNNVVVKNDLSSNSIHVNDISINNLSNFNNSGNKINFSSHFIPTANETYDLGNAEYKIRHLFLSDNSLWVGDKNKISIENGDLKFLKLKTDYTLNNITEEQKLLLPEDGDFDNIYENSLSLIDKIKGIEARLEAAGIP